MDVHCLSIHAANIYHSLCLGVIIALPAATPKEYRNTASYAFGDWSNTSGYPDGFAFVLGMLAGASNHTLYDIILTLPQCTGPSGIVINTSHNGRFD
jgi:hypothetical protein